jgi:hypothetical protein
MEELTPPEEVFSDPNSIELLRAWLSNDQLLVVLQSLNFPAGAATYGMMLADIARHSADMLHQAYGYPKLSTLQEICRVFIAEMKADTGQASGGFVQPTLAADD